MNWSKCNKYKDCKDECKEIVTYCDIRSCFEGEVVKMADDELLEYLTERIFQYLDQSQETYTKGSLSNQDRAKYIVDLVKGSFKTASIKDAERDKVVGEILKEITDWMEGGECGGFERVQTDWKSRQSADTFNSINQVYEEDWKEFKQYLESKWGEK